MNDVERAAREIGQVDRFRDRLGFQLRRARVFLEVGAVQAFAEGLVLQVVDDGAVFGVDEHGAPVSSHDIERRVEVFVRDAAAAAPLLVAHHDLERRDAAIDGLGYLGEVVEVLEYPGVQREVDHAPRFALLADAPQRGEHGLVLLARGEDDHGGDAPVRGAAGDVGQGIDMVGVRPAVDVGVDDAGHDEPARHVQHLIGCGHILRRADTGDLPVADAESGLLAALAGYDRAAPHEQVERFLLGTVCHENLPCGRPPSPEQTGVSRPLLLLRNDPASKRQSNIHAFADKEGAYHKTRTGWLLMGRLIVGRSAARNYL